MSRKKKLPTNNDVVVIRFSGGHLSFKENGDVLISQLREDGHYKYSKFKFGQPCKTLVVEINGKAVHYSEEKRGGLAVVNLKGVEAEDEEL